MQSLQLGVSIASHFDGKVRKMWLGERAAYGELERKIKPGDRYVWFHAASLGEFEQGRPLIEQLRKEHPEYKILLSFYSPSGYEVRKDYKGADIVCYMPVDTRKNARRFIDLVKPEMAFFIKYEFWYNFIHELYLRHIPVYSVSSIFRPDQIFFRWYGKSYGKVLRCVTHFFVQNEKSRQLLNYIGINDVDIVGDTRFDRVLQIKEASKRLPIVESFVGQCPQVFVAGSSWPPDEERFMPYFNAHREWKLIIAPHVIGEDHLKLIMGLIKDKKVVRYTQTTAEEAAKADVLIIDCFGLLSSIYNYGTVSYVGGGFGVGIHNVLEAAVWDMPVIFGPNNKRFQEAQGLMQAGGGFEYNTSEEFAALMDKFAGDSSYLKDCGSKAGKFVQSLAGATKKILAAIKL